MFDVELAKKAVCELLVSEMLQSPRFKKAFKKAKVDFTSLLEQIPNFEEKLALAVCFQVKNSEFFGEPLKYCATLDDVLSMMSMLKISLNSCINDAIKKIGKDHNMVNSVYEDAYNQGFDKAPNYFKLPNFTNLIYDTIGMLIIQQAQQQNIEYMQQEVQIIQPTLQIQNLQAVQQQQVQNAQQNVHQNAVLNQSNKANNYKGR